MTDKKTDMAPFAARDVPAAIGLLTRLPVPVDHARATARGARAAWAYPVAGLAAALLGGAVYTLGTALGWPAPLSAGLVVLVMVMLTGAMHEDGLADCADGFWGGFTKERRLEIMKDSRIGAYGVIALVLSLLLRWAALVAAIEADQLWPMLIIAAMASRAGMVAVMALVPHARPGGLSASVGRPEGSQAAVAIGLACIGALVLMPTAVFSVAVGAVMACLFCAALAHRKIGGQTGDVLGATQQVTEIAVLLALIGA